MIGASRPGAIAGHLNRRFDQAVGLYVRVGPRQFHSWRAFSLAAFGVATAVWLVIGIANDQPIVALALVPLVSVTIFSVHRRHLIRSGESARLIFHRHLAASTVVAVPLLAFFDALSWQAIDGATTAVLMGLAVGRVGCLRTGCCSGRPASIGPRYPWLPSEHRRFPVQLLDAATCVVLAVATIICQALGAAGGVATGVGLGGYFVIRFVLDELRDERVRTRRRTEAQRLAILAAILGAAWIAGTVALW